jgi:hypothetical protein
MENLMWACTILGEQSPFLLGLTGGEDAHNIVILQYVRDNNHFCEEKYSGKGERVTVNAPLD